MATAEASPHRRPAPTPAHPSPSWSPAPAPSSRRSKPLGVTDVFGLPGGAIMPFYDELMASTSIRHILVRHEQGAGHAAEGYAAAQRPGRCRDRDLRPRRHQPRDRDRRCATWTRCRRSRSPARSSPPRWGRMRSRRRRYRRHHDADHQALLPREPRRGRRHPWRRRSTSRPRDAPARCSSM